MNVTHKLTLDLQDSGQNPVLELMQRDWNARMLDITLLSGGESWEIPAGAAVIISYEKPDGKGGQYDTLPDGTKAWIAEGNVLTLTLAPQMLTTAGPVTMNVAFLEGSQRITSFSVALNVREALGCSAEDSVEYSYLTGFLPGPARAKVGQFFRVGAINEKGMVTTLEAVDKEMLLNEGASDEELLAASYTLTADDYVYGLWNGPLDAGSDVPYTTTDIGDKFCTRKIKTTLLPKMSYYYFTTPSEYVFWNNGEYVGKIDWATLSADWTVGFEFDEVGINFSWGYDYVGTEVVVRLTVAVADFDKVLVLGDSISADYYGNYTKWVTLLIEQGFFPASTNNDSIHATGFVARYTAEGDTDNDLLHRIQAVTDKDSYDLVVVFAGINDYIQSIPMGESGGDAAAGFVPAVDSFFAYLTQNFSGAKIAVLLPLRTYNTEANSQGILQSAYGSYIHETARRYCLPVLNLTEESGFRPFDETFRNQWTLVPEGYDSADGVHPNAEYQSKFLAPMIRNFLERFA